MVLTQRALPEIGSKTRVRGHVEQAFALGSEQKVVFIEDAPSGQ